MGGTVRSDGSVRPIAKVRPGYLAKEDAPKYKPRGARERDAKLGIASATSPVVRVEAEETNTEGGDSKSAIKARIQAMKAEFERKKMEKAGQREVVEEVKTNKEPVKDVAKKTTELETEKDISDLSVSLGSLDIKPKTNSGTDIASPATSTAPSKLQSRHSKKEAAEPTPTQPKPVLSKPTTNVTPQKTPLKSRHAKAKESSDTSDSVSEKTSTTPTSGYVPPHIRK